MKPLDTIDPFGIDWRCTLAPSLTAQETPDPSVAVAGQVSNRPPYVFHLASVARLSRLTAISPVSRSVLFCCHFRVCYAENFVYLLHRCPLAMRLGV